MFKVSVLKRNLKRKKIIIGIIASVVVVAALITTAILMDCRNVSVVNSNEKAGTTSGGGKLISGSSTTIRAIAFDGYSFDRWTNKDGSEASTEPVYTITVPESNITLTANWSTIDYDINYHFDNIVTLSNPEAFPDNQTYTVTDDTVFLATPLSDDYTFLGWYLDPEFEKPALDFIPTGSFNNVHLYPKWSLSYKITYDLGGDLTHPVSNSPENPDTYTEDADVLLASPVCYEVGTGGALTGGSYRFLGWKDSNGNIIKTISKTLKSDLTLTATWDFVSAPVYYTVSSIGKRQYIEFGHFPNHIADARTTNYLKAHVDINGDGSITATDGQPEITPDPTTGWYMYKNNYYAMLKADPYQNFYQFSNGDRIEKDKTYFFLVEPIKWRVLDGDITKAGDKIFVLAEDILSAGAFQTNTKVRSERDKIIYANNWEASLVRNWLNNTFLNSAFKGGEQDLILMSDVDFSKRVSHYSKYANGSSAPSKIFLLSYRNTANRAFAWNHWTIKEDDNKKAKTTDYSRAIGAYSSINGGAEKNCGHWWLRTSGDFENYASLTTALGTVGTWDVSCTAIGIRPAMEIILN